MDYYTDYVTKPGPKKAIVVAKKLGLLASCNLVFSNSVILFIPLLASQSEVWAMHMVVNYNFLVPELCC